MPYFSFGQRAQEGVNSICTNEARSALGPLAWHGRLVRRRLSATPKLPAIFASFVLARGIFTNKLYCFVRICCHQRMASNFGERCDISSPKVLPLPLCCQVWSSDFCYARANLSRGLLQKLICF